MRVVVNPLASRADYSSAEARIVLRTLAETARREIGQWQGYAVTPLRSLDRLARELGLGCSIKMSLVDSAKADSKHSVAPTPQPSKLREFRSSVRTTLCCATDGKHGRSVAFAAAPFGQQCVVYMPEHAPAGKAAAIAALGTRTAQRPRADSRRDLHHDGEDPLKRPTECRCPGKSGRPQKPGG